MFGWTVLVHNVVQVDTNTGITHFWFGPSYHEYFKSDGKGLPLKDKVSISSSEC